MGGAGVACVLRLKAPKTTKYKVGTVVSCDYCGGHRAIEEIRMYKGGMGFELSCGDEAPVPGTEPLPDTICRVPPRAARRRTFFVDAAKVPIELLPDIDLIIDPIELKAI
ncbi:MAG: hypothetical protein IPO41_17640 [Acidobacteria bacterium]|nr:hypothetical protein [Acidobacteriota bacterium]